MCYFFSFVTEPENYGGKRFYFGKDMRIPANGDSWDSHSVICNFFKLDEDKCNKYEYDPDKKLFKIDKLNSRINDSVQAEEWVENLDFDNIVVNNTQFEEGDILKPKSLEYLKSHRSDVRCHWVDSMDEIYPKIKNGILVTKSIINDLNKDIYKFDLYGWKISLDMLELNQ